MTPKQVREHFKSGYNLNKQTGLSHSLLGLWERQGHIPRGSQHIIEYYTNGTLKADEVVKNDK